MAEIIVITAGEMEAFRLLGPNSFSTDTSPTEFHKAANRIIALAEQIKAERAIAAMEFAAEAAKQSR